MYSNQVNNLMKSFSSLSSNQPSNLTTTQSTGNQNIQNSDQNLVREILDIKQNQMSYDEKLRAMNKNIELNHKKIDDIRKMLEDTISKLIPNIINTNMHHEQIAKLEIDTQKAIALTGKGNLEQIKKLEKNISEINQKVDKIAKISSEIKPKDNTIDEAIKKDIEMIKENKKTYESSISSLLK